MALASCTSVKYKEINYTPTAGINEALIYFFRERRFSGGGVSYYIYEGSENGIRKLGALKNGTYFFIKARPGIHTYWAKTEAKDSVTLDVQGGRTYYIEGKVGFGLFAGRPDLTISNELQGRSEIPKLRYAVAN